MKMHRIRLENREGRILYAQRKLRYWAEVLANARIDLQRAQMDYAKDNPEVVEEMRDAIGGVK